MESLTLAALLALSPGTPAPPARGAAVAPCVFDGRTGLPAPFSAALARARASKVVYAGEKHDSAAHHALQRDLIAALGANAGFEMLYASQQAPLDAYLSGVTDAAGFQAAVDWKKTWGFPFALYEPVFERLRASRAKGAALNLEKSIVHKVAETGLASLTPAERSKIPADFQATTDGPYLAMLRDTFAAHGGDVNDAAALARFVDAMSLWNEAMAANLVAFSDRNAGAPVVVVAGAFHAYAAGVPASVARRRPGLAQTSFVFFDEPACPASVAPGLAIDYVWVVTP